MEMEDGHMREKCESLEHATQEQQRQFICGVIEGFYGRPWTTEQRKDLFRKLKKLGMDFYMYAPKDDYKHRAYWRELYTVEEADHLSSILPLTNFNSCRVANLLFFFFSQVSSRPQRKLELCFIMRYRLVWI